MTLVMFLMAGCMIGHAQVMQLNCDSNNYAVFRKVKGDMIKVECDTIYVLNKFTFDLMFNSYNNYRNQNLLLSQYAELNDSISSLYESQLDSQKVYFDTLNFFFKSLADNSDSLVKRSSLNIDSVSSDLNVIKTQVQQAKADIEAAKLEINLAKKNIRKQNWKWGIGGFTAGSLITLVLGFVL